MYLTIVCLLCLAVGNLFILIDAFYCALFDKGPHWVELMIQIYESSVSLFKENLIDKLKDRKETNEELL